MYIVTFTTNIHNEHIIFKLLLYTALAEANKNVDCVTCKPTVQALLRDLLKMN